MLYYRIQKHKSVALRMERIIFIFHGLAVQSHEISGLSEYGSELVHDSAFHSAIVMFCRLAYTCKFEFVYIAVEQIIQGKCVRTFKCCGG